MMARMADANKDGAVTRDEFLAAQGRHFAMMDANKDGTVTAEERKAGRAKMREHMRGMRAGAGQPGKDGHEGH
jgi:EF hand